jgi:hypothetical protein
VSSSAVLIDGPVDVKQPPVQIRHYFVFSLFSAICLCPATGRNNFYFVLIDVFFLFEGLIALAYSIKSSAKADINFHEKARLYSRRALLWNLLSVIFAVLSVVLV